MGMRELLLLCGSKIYIFIYILDGRVTVREGDFDFDCDRITETNGYFSKMSHAYKSDSGVQYVSQKKNTQVNKVV